MTTAPARTAVLTTSDVAVHFGGIKAVDGVDLGIAPGEILGILGPNGSGKSTLLAAVTRLVPLTRGRLSLDGTDYTGSPAYRLARRGIARTFQTVRLLPDLTVLENVQLGADLHLPRASRLRELLRRGAVPEVAEAVERTGIGDALDRRPGELSYGTARRVEIARALAAGPRVLLLDEPTAGMNQPERREVAGLLRRLRDEGLAQLLVEHDVQMMVDTCDRLLAMNQGVRIAEGAPTDVVEDAGVQSAYLGRPSGPQQGGFAPVEPQQSHLAATREREAGRAADR
ncbi:ABC transporter ATP-binding protein [Pseudonocardia adelaidensis]|uniref:ABC transporter ATP-binding protein n=1 Tax=Pseudonocardia adelaidensis TaxID=648754 RepID=A0ABP9P1L9_9PSEU